MATDYDAPRKTDDDSESIEALKERVPDKMSGSLTSMTPTIRPDSNCPVPICPTLIWTSWSFRLRRMSSRA